MIWNNKVFQYAILFILAFVWGSSFILMKIGLVNFSSENAAIIRMTSAAITLLPFALKNLKGLKPADYGILALSGFLGNFFPAFMFTKAQTEISSSLAGMLNSLTPVFTLLIGIVFLRVKFGIRQMGGFILGLVGALGLVFVRSGVDFSGINFYALIVVIATLLYGININLVKSKLSHLSGIQITSISFAATLPASLICLFSSDFIPQLTNTGLSYSLLALITLGVIGSAIAMIFMNSLIRYSSAVFASSVTYIIPIFAILWGVLDNEVVNYKHLLCMSAILIGVYLINKK
ncbi:MAG: DMT family transporter [Marinifilaceae bacterium]|jgi:drug/metabolite transporter (DMT)-like permease|nr:DMT family transporter [Marinifilaceae bacterium]